MRFFLGGNEGCWSPPCDFCTPIRSGSRVDFLLGYRYLQLRDRIGVEENLASFATTEPAETAYPYNRWKDLQDEFSTKDVFHGGQIGLLISMHRNRWSLEVTPKIAFGNTHETASVNGSTMITDYPINSTVGTTATYQGAAAGPAVVEPRQWEHRQLFEERIRRRAGSRPYARLPVDAPAPGHDRILLPVLEPGHASRQSDRLQSQSEPDTGFHQHGVDFGSEPSGVQLQSDRLLGPGDEPGARLSLVRHRNELVSVAEATVGWVNRSEPHRNLRKTDGGSPALDAPYKSIQKRTVPSVIPTRTREPWLSVADFTMKFQGAFRPPPSP